MVDRRYIYGLLIVVCCFALVVPSVSAGEVVTIETNTQYNGIEGESQAVSVEVTITAEETISGLKFAAAPTEKSFLAYESFTTTTSADVNLKHTGPGKYRVEELKQGESITVSFAAYPRTLKTKELQVAVVRITAENPQTLERKTGVTADLSSSPWFAYQDAKKKLENKKLLGGVGRFTFYGALVFGIFGIVLAGYTRFISMSKVEDRLEDEYVQDLQDMKSDMPYSECQKRVQQEIDDRDQPLLDGGGGDDWDEF